MVPLASPQGRVPARAPEAPLNAPVKSHSVSVPEGHLFSTFAALEDRLGKTFVCGTPVLTVEDVLFTPSGFAAAGILAKMNMHFQGEPGTGKTLLAEAIYNVFGGMGRGAWFRADLDLDVRAEYCHINPRGASFEEVFEVRQDMVDTHIAVVDEIGRAHATKLNPVMGLMEGRLKLQGMRVYELGNGYFIVISTTNPTDAGTFELADALQDRSIGLDFDGLKPRDGDVAMMEMRSAGRDKLVADESLVPDIIAAHRFLIKDLEGDNEEQFNNRCLRALLAQLVFDAFKFITQDGKIFGNKVFEKRDDGSSWRNLIPDDHKANHAQGHAISFCGPISRRVLRQTGRLAHTLYGLAAIQKDLNGRPISEPLDTYCRTYVDCALFGVARRHKFLPPGVAAQLGISREDMIRGARNDIINQLNCSAIGTVSVWLRDFDTALRQNNSTSLVKAKSILANAKAVYGNERIPVYGYGVTMMENWLEQYEKQRIDRATAARNARNLCIGYVAPEADGAVKAVPGVDVAGTVDKTISTPLTQEQLNEAYIQAVLAEDASQVALVLSQGADPNTCDNEAVPMLIRAVTQRRPDVLDTILGDPRTDVDITESNGWPAIGIAVRQLNATATQRLMAHAPAPRLTMQVNGKEYTMLKVLAIAGKNDPEDPKIQRIRVLFEQSADPANAEAGDAV